MVRARPSSVVAAVALASALLFAACGGDDDDTTTSSAVATDPASTDAVTTDATISTDAPVETTPETAAPADTTAPETVPATDAPAVTEVALGNVIEVATAAGTFNTFLAAIETAGLTDKIANDGKYTFLAPTDETIAAAMDQASIDAMLADPAAALALVNTHVLPGSQDAHGIAVFNNIVNIGGASLQVVAEGDSVVVQGATVVTADIPADNGYIHIIDSIITPPAA